MIKIYNCELKLIIYKNPKNDFRNNNNRNSDDANMHFTFYSIK